MWNISIVKYDDNLVVLMGSVIRNPKNNRIIYKYKIKIAEHFEAGTFLWDNLLKLKPLFSRTKQWWWDGKSIVKNEDEEVRLCNDENFSWHIWTVWCDENRIPLFMLLLTSVKTWHHIYQTIKVKYALLNNTELRLLLKILLHKM